MGRLMFDSGLGSDATLGSPGVVVTQAWGMSLDLSRCVEYLSCFERVCLELGDH